MTFPLLRAGLSPGSLPCYPGLASIRVLRSRLLHSGPKALFLPLFSLLWFRLKIKSADTLAPKVFTSEGYGNLILKLITEFRSESRRSFSLVLPEP